MTPKLKNRIPLVYSFPRMIAADTSLGGVALTADGTELTADTTYFSADQTIQ